MTDTSPAAVERLAATFDEDARHLDAACGAGDAEHYGWCMRQQAAAATLRALLARAEAAEAAGHARGVREAAALCKSRAHMDYDAPLSTAANFMHEAFACERAILALLPPTTEAPA